MTDKIQDRLLKASRYEVRKEAADYIDKLEAVVEKVANVEDIEVMLSTRDLAILCNAAVLKGQSLQDFVFLAAWNAANTVLNETRRDDDICSGVKVYQKGDEK